MPFTAILSFENNIIFMLFYKIVEICYHSFLKHEITKENS